MKLHRAERDEEVAVTVSHESRYPEATVNEMKLSRKTIPLASKLMRKQTAAEDYEIDLNLNQAMGSAE